MGLRDVPLNLMETLKCWSSLHEYTVVLMFLITVTKGLACEAPSSPECFKRNADESVYMCEWNMNTTESHVKFDLHVEKKTFRSIQTTCLLSDKPLVVEQTCQTSLLNEEWFIVYRIVPIWVEAHVGNSSCISTRRSVVLWDTVKYEAPLNISMSWLKSDLNLNWTAAEEHPALAEIRLRHDEQPMWEKRTTNTTSDTFTYHALVQNLLKDSVYQVQIRHRSTQARNPLWSDWSLVVTVPADLEQKPEVTVTTTLLNGARKVMLTWKPMPHAAAVRGVTYSLTDTQSSHGCPCEANRNPINASGHTAYVSLSAVNISIIARNEAGYSPPAIIQLPADPTADLKICEKTLLDDKLKKKICLELYELRDGDSRPGNVITLTTRNSKKERKQIKMNLKDYVRYLYFEHRCHGGKPQTVKMCLFYQKEGAPLREPLELNAFNETYTSAILTWRAIPSADQRGFLTHYSLCSMKISSKDEPKVCHNISASLIQYRLEDLTPGVKYNISLVGVTRMGEGPEAILTFNTLPEENMSVWWSLGFMVLFFFITTMCTYTCKRIRNKIFPPVPMPVFPDFIPYQPESQECLERKEVLHEVTLHQHPEGKSIPEDAEETTVLTEEWDEGMDEDGNHDSGDSRVSGGTGDECPPGSTGEEALRSSTEGEITDLEQVDNEIAMLIYRNGLVFDVKTDSP